MSTPQNDDPLYDGPVKITRASYSLQDKAGSGEIDPALIARAEQILSSNNEDFTPLALEQIAKLARIVGRIKTHQLYSSDIIQELVAPIMQLKANGRIFQYDLVSSMTATMLSFLETLDRLDGDIVALVEAHQLSLQVIVARQMKGSGGSDGQRLQQELEDAIARYNRKHPVGFKETLN